jgi:hypothetical protein
VDAVAEVVPVVAGELVELRDRRCFELLPGELHDVVDQGIGWYFSAMPRNPPNETTANRMLFDSLSRRMSSTSPIFLPDLSCTGVPQTFVARIADV